MCRLSLDFTYLIFTVIIKSLNITTSWLWKPTSGQGYMARIVDYTKRSIRTKCLIFFIWYARVLIPEIKSRILCVSYKFICNARVFRSGYVSKISFLFSSFRLIYLTLYASAWHVPVHWIKPPSTCFVNALPNLDTLTFNPLL